MTGFSDILIRTAAQGGALIFLSEGLTPTLQHFLSDLQKTPSGKILFGVRSLDDLRSEWLQVQAKDLLLVGALSLEQQLEVATICNCQIFYEGRSLRENLSDFTGQKLSAQTLAAVDPMGPIYTQGLQDLLSFFKAPGRFVRMLPVRAKNISRVLFLDRDDVVVKNIPYNKDPEQVSLLPGVTALIQRAHKMGYLVIVCSNQSGLGRGLIRTDEYLRVHQKMLALLAQESVWIEDVLWASYIDSAQGGVGTIDSHLRKPRPGMFLQAAAKWSVDMGHSLMVGDSASDLFAAHTAGVKRLYLLKSEKAEKEKALLAEYQKDFSFSYEFVFSLDAIKI